MKSRPLALIPAIVVLVAACSSSGASPSAPGAEPSAAPAASTSAATRIDIALTDELRMEPSSMTVPAGVPVTFVITNTGAIEHEFVLGDEEAQVEHEAEMAAGGMRHDEPDAVAVAPGQSKELTYTFAEPGETLAGCHFPGHYDAGMKATITVTG
jgi:uncharacterized cupredoxin-like copper-binding protein